MSRSVAVTPPVTDRRRDMAEAAGGGKGGHRGDGERGDTITVTDEQRTVTNGLIMALSVRATMPVSRLRIGDFSEGL